MLKNDVAISTCIVAFNVVIGASGHFVALLTDADLSLLDWMFQHYNSVDIRMSRDPHDEIGHEQWFVSAWDNTKMWRTSSGLTISDAIKNLISRINEVENEKIIWIQS